MAAPYPILNADDLAMLQAFLTDEQRENSGASR